MPPASEVSPQAASLSMSSSSALRQVSDKDFLRKAWKAISKRNMQSKGIDNVTLKSFKERLEENLSIVSTELKTSQYQFHQLRAHAMKKPNSKKPRPLQIATVRDRVVMKALALYIEPTFDRFNLPCSYAFIKERGVPEAVQRIQSLISHGQRFYFEADIIDFFNKVDRNQLWKRFADKVRHKSLLDLLYQCFNLELEDLESHESEFQDLFAHAGSGIPQGGVLSPMLANFYLYYFDKRMLSQGFNLIRYADDFVVMCDSIEAALRAHDVCKATLKSLNLDIHPLGDMNSKSRIGDYSKDGLTFLGIHFRDGEVFPTAKVVDRFKSKVDEILQPNAGLTLFNTLQRLSNLLNGWGKCYRSMRVAQIYQSLDDYVRASLESYLLLLGFQVVNKKRKPMKVLGVPSLQAMLEHSRHRFQPAKPPVITKPGHISKQVFPPQSRRDIPRPTHLPFPIT